MLTPTNTKRLRDSPTFDGTPTKSAKMQSGNDLEPQNNNVNDPNAKLLAAIKKMMVEELDSKIKEAVKTSFTEELDKRLENMASKLDVDALRQTIESQKQENDALKEKLGCFENRLERIDKNDRSNKLIFSNVACPDGAISAAYHVCNQMLRINPELINIKSSFVLRKFDNDRSTILVEFAERNMVTTVFKHIKNLNGSRVGVERDLTENQQKVRKMLVDLKRKLLDNNKQMKIHVSDVTLKIGSNKFTFKNGNLEASLAGLDVNKFFMDNYKIKLDEYLNKKD